MPYRSTTILAGAFLSLGVLASAQSPASKPGEPSVVQPGAPGQPSKQLSVDARPTPPRPPSKPDVDFMQGMIMHHSQAVEMTALLKQKGASPELQELGNRIEISQTDEIGFMKRWLTDRGLPLAPTVNGMSMDMPGMDMSSMMPSMPGMLTKAQMTALRNSTGPQFDHLFLTGMIQHHTGALSMVKDLFKTPGAAQDPMLFDFTSDVDNTQQAEIDIMHSMLAKEKH